MLDAIELYAGDPNKANQYASRAKKVVEANKGSTEIQASYIIDQLGELGWDYSCGRMSRSGMEIYDGIMRHVGVIKPYEHWNEDVYADANGDW